MALNTKISETITGNTTVNLLMADNPFVSLTIEADAEINFSNLCPGQNRLLEINQDGTGGHTVTFNSSTVETPGGTTPSFTTTANAKDVFTFFMCENGTKLRIITEAFNVK
jgi:hypothetical protein